MKPLTEVLLFWCQEMEEAWIAGLIDQQELEWGVDDLEQCVAEDRTLYEREPDFWSAREATDPHWPPAEVDPFESTDGNGEDPLSVSIEPLFVSLQEAGLE